MDESGRPVRIQGRLAEVHKTLCSASKCAKACRDGWITNGGGYLIPDDSALSHKIKKLIDAEASKPGNQVIPMYQENGVYNFYLNVGSEIEGSKVEAMAAGDSRMAPRGAEEGTLAAVKKMIKEEVEKEVEDEMRKRNGSSGFTRQPIA